MPEPAEILKAPPAPLHKVGDSTEKHARALPHGGNIELAMAAKDTAAIALILKSRNSDLMQRHAAARAAQLGEL